MQEGRKEAGRRGTEYCCCLAGKVETERDREKEEKEVEIKIGGKSTMSRSHITHTE